MLLRPPPLHEQQDNLSHVISQSDARQSSKSRNKIKKKQNSLSFRNKPIASSKQTEQRDRQDNGSVHSHASGRSKKSKKKESSIGLNRPRGGHLLNSPRKSQQDDIEVLDYVESTEDRQPKIQSYGIQYSEVKRDYAQDYSPKVYQNRSPNIQIKPSFKSALTNKEYEKQTSFKQDQDDQIPVVKLVQAKGKNQTTSRPYNVHNVISPKIAERQQTRKLGQLFEENRRNINQLGVSGVPSQINNSSSIVGESRRSRSKLGQLFKQKSRQKQVSNNSRVSFTQNSSSISDINLSNAQQPIGTKSRQKQSVNKNNLPEKVLEESIQEFQAHNLSQLNLSMSRNSPMVSKHQAYPSSLDGNKDSVCFNIQPERQRRKKGLGLSSKMKDDDEMLKFSGDMVSKQIQPRFVGNNKQQDAHERLKMNLKQNEKYLIQSGVMGVPQNEIKEQEQKRRRQEEARKKEQRDLEIAQERKRQERVLLQQRKADELRAQQENLRRQEQKKREEEQIRLEAEKKIQKQRKQKERKQNELRQTEIRKQQQRKLQQRKQKEKREKQRRIEQQRIQRQREEQQQNQRIRVEEEQAERKRRERQIERQKLQQKQADEQRKANLQRQRQRQQQKKKQFEKQKLQQQEEARRQRQRLKNAYKSEQEKLKQNSQRSLVYQLENQSLNQPELSRKGKKNELEHIPSSYSLQQSSRDSSKSKQSRKSTRKKQGVIPSKTQKHVISDASPRAQQSFYQQSHQEQVLKKSQPIQPIQTSQAPRKLMSFPDSDDLAYEPKNQYKTDTYFYDRSSKAYSKPPLSKKSGSSKSKPKQSSIKKQTKDSQVKIMPAGQTKPAGQKKLSIVELAMRKNYQPQSGSEYQSQDSFRSRENSVNSSGSRNSRNSGGSKKKQSTIKIQKGLNRPPLYHKSSSQNENSLMNRTAQHEKQMTSRQKYDMAQRQQKTKVIKGCSFIDERGRLVQNGNMIVRGAEISGSMTKIGGLTQQKFAQKLMKSRDRRRSQSRQRSLQRSRASSRSIQKGNSKYDPRSQCQYAESEAYQQSQYSQQDRRYETSGTNFYQNTRNDQSFYQNSASRNNIPIKNQRIPQNLQQFMKPIQQAGINRQTEIPRNSQYTYQRKQPQNNIIKKRIMQRTEKPRGY